MRWWLTSALEAGWSAHIDELNQALDERKGQEVGRVGVTACTVNGVYCR